jgi:hypothetical protein
MPDPILQPNDMATGTHLETRLDWPLNFIVMLVVGLPAFIGFPLNVMKAEILAGIRWSWAAYFVVVHVAVLQLSGRRLYANIVAVAALITMPVVFFGAGIFWIAYYMGLGSGDEVAAGSHYVQLCLTMLTVLPLALGLVSMVPFGRIERNLLVQPAGVTALQKKMLMAMRVFNHIAFFVLPNTLEVLREEQAADQFRHPWRQSGNDRILNRAIHLAVEIICAALQYLPLWAYEIARLPEPENKRRSKKNPD